MAAVRDPARLGHPVRSGVAPAPRASGAERAAVGRFEAGHALDQRASSSWRGLCPLTYPRLGLSRSLQGGKYGAGIVYYLVYFIWRENGDVHLCRHG